MIISGSVLFTAPKPLDGSLRYETCFNDTQLCTQPGTVSGAATPTESLNANLTEIL